MAYPQPSNDQNDPLSNSSLTLPSSSSAYHPSTTPSPPSNSSESSPVILYKPPTIWSLLQGAAINLLLPFVNGLMLGFGELFAHEAAFRLGWSGTKIFPQGSASHPIGPGVEVRDNFGERIARGRQREDADLEDLASLE